MTMTENNQNNSNAVQDFFMRLGVLGELLGFLWRRKLYWLIPLVVALLFFAVIIIIGSTGPGGAFIYTLF